MSFQLFPGVPALAWVCGGEEGELASVLEQQHVAGGMRWAAGTTRSLVSSCCWEMQGQAPSTASWLWQGRNDPGTASFIPQVSATVKRKLLYLGG